MLQIICGFMIGLVSGAFLMLALAAHAKSDRDADDEEMMLNKEEKR